MIYKICFLLLLLLQVLPVVSMLLITKFLFNSIYISVTLLLVTFYADT